MSRFPRRWRGRQVDWQQRRVHRLQRMRYTVQPLDGMMWFQRKRFNALSIQLYRQRLVRKDKLHCSNSSINLWFQINIFKRTSVTQQAQQQGLVFNVKTVTWPKWTFFQAYRTWAILASLTAYSNVSHILLSSESTAGKDDIARTAFQTCRSSNWLSQSRITQRPKFSICL